MGKKDNISNIQYKQNVQFKKIGLLPTLDKYIFKEFLVIFLCCMLAFLILFIIGDITDDLSDFLEHDASIYTIIYYFLLKQPGNIKFVFPIALLLSCMYTMAKMGMNSEITAMRASGISLIRCGLSIYLIAFIVTGINMWFNESLGPKSNRQAYILRKSVAIDDYSRKIRSMLMYRSYDDERTWLVKDFPSRNKLNQVQIKKYNNKGELELELNAKKAKYFPDKGWKFYNCKYVNYKKTQLTDRFSEKSLGKKQSIIVPAIKRYKVFDKEDKKFSKLGGVNATPQDLLNAIKTPQEMSTFELISILNKTDELSERTEDIYYTLIYSRFAFPWVCLLSVFLGVPLAAANERSGIMLSIVKAIIVITVYTILSQIFKVLGNRGYMPPILAGTAPTLALIAYIWHTVIKQK